MATTVFLRVGRMFIEAVDDDDEPVILPGKRRPGEFIVRDETKQPEERKSDGKHRPRLRRRRRTRLQGSA